MYGSHSNHHNGSSHNSYLSPAPSSRSSRSPAPGSQGRTGSQTPRDLHEQLKEMQKDILGLSDKFRGVDPIEKAAMETLAQSRIPIEEVPLLSLPLIENPKW